MFEIGNKVRVTKVIVSGKDDVDTVVDLFKFIDKIGTITKYCGQFNDHPWKVKFENDPHNYNFADQELESN